MILQKIVWGAEAPAGTEALYYHAGVRLRSGEAGLQIPENTSVSFDTYFNAFPAGQWKRCTAVRQIRFRISVNGAGRALLMKRGGGNPEGPDAGKDFLHTARKSLPEEDRGRPVCIAETEFSGKQTIAFHLAVTDSGLYYIALETTKETVFESGAVETDEPAREIRLALVTCTYRREAEILRNLRILRRENREAGDGAVLEKIFVVDNAKSLLPEQMEDERIRLIPNANTGGSGGFARGLREAMRFPELTHVILMDDDVQIEFEAFRRTRSFLQYIKEEYRENFVGGAMLRRDLPYILYAAGEDWAAGRIRNPYRNTDLRISENILRTAKPLRGKQLYAGWWYCCIPRKHIEQKGYPLPFFLHCDDVEYSLRSGRPPLYLSGIAVWHEEFEDKRSSALEYYDTRNRLITNAIYPERSRCKNAAAVLCERFYATVFRYRYRDFALSVRAAEDFLKGPGWLYRTDAEALHQAVLEEGYRPRALGQQELFELQEPFELQKPFKLQEPFEPMKTGAESGCEYGKNLHIIRSRMGKIRTIVRYFLQASGKTAVRMGAPVSACAGKKQVLLLEPKSQTGFEVQKSWRETAKCMGELLRIMPGLLFGSRRAGKEWRKQPKENAEKTGRKQRDEKL